MRQAFCFLLIIMEKYGVCKNTKTAGMGPSVGYCEICKAPIIYIKNKKTKTCSCKSFDKKPEKK